MYKKFFCSLILGAMVFSLSALPSLMDKHSFDSASIQNLDVSLSWESITFKPVNNSDFFVEVYYGKKKYCPDVRLSSSTLIIESKHFDIGSKSDSKGCEVMVYIPANQKFKKIHISSTSGKVMGDLPYSEKVTAQTTSGSIKFETCITDFFDSSSTSGSITVSKLSCKCLNISTLSGTVGLELQRSLAKNSSISTTSGLIFISMPENSQISVRATTSSGGFTNSFTRDTFNSLVNYSKAINGGGPLLKLSSTSGTITLDSNTFITSPIVIYEDDPDAEIPVVIFDENDF